MRTVYRIGAVAAVVVVFCFASSACVLAQPSFELGVKAGLGLAQLNGDDTQESEIFLMDLGDGYYALGEINLDFTDSKLGFIGGAYAAVHITNQFGIRLEGLYTKKGGKGNTSGNISVYDNLDNYVGTIDISGENTVTLDYFEFPLLGVVSFPVGPTATFDIFAGPALAFKTNAELETEIIMSANGYTETESEITDIGDEIKGTDFGGILGAGITINLPTVNLFGEVRYEYGFTNIPDGAEDGDLKNSAFSFQVGMGIPLAKIP